MYFVNLVQETRVTERAKPQKRSKIYWYAIQIELLILIGHKPTTMDNRKRTKGQTIMYKTLHRKLNIEQHEPINLR
jgi:hypothetical protein